MRPPIRSIARAAAAFLLVALAGCDSVSNLLSPGRPAGEAPATLAFQATLPRFQQSAFTTLDSRVLAQYERADESLVTIGTQNQPLSTDAPTQQLPLSIELGGCLGDPARREAASDPSACFVRLTLTLIGDGRVLDNVQVPTVRLTPGGTSTVAQPVQLFEVASVSITAAANTTPISATGVGLVTGATYPAAARPVDATGAAITGRAVAWSSSNAAVASVSAAGVVTAVAPGSATISATVGGRTGSALFTVTPPPQLLTVVAVASTGTGRVTSLPAGIDCVVTAGVASGSCSASFAAGTVVQLSSTVNPANATFTGWTGACLSNGTQPNCTLTMDQPRTTGVAYTGLSSITVQSGGAGVRIVSGPATGISCTLNGAQPTGTCSALFPIGSTVILTPDHFSTARVSDFTGCTAATPTSCSILVEATPRTVSVNVVPGRLLLVSPVGAGSGIISAPGVDPLVPSPNIGCGLPATISTGLCSSLYPIGSQVLVTATPQPGSTFAGWLGGGCDNVSANTCLVTMSAAQVQVRATFQPTAAPVTFVLSGSGGGRVFANGVLKCELGVQQTSTQCVVTLPLNQLIQFTGAPLTSGQFLGFGGACPQTPTCALTLTGPVSISASFDATPPNVLITATPRAGNTGRGSISDSEEEMNCDINTTSATGVCSIARAYGEEVTVYAGDFSDGQLFVFSRWGQNSPCPNSVEPECTFLATTPNTIVDAEFVPAQPLDIYLDGGEDGEFRVSVAGFRSLYTCAYIAAADPMECPYLVPDNATVSVEAITNASLAVDTGDAQFCSWGGPIWNPSCSFTISEPISGTLYFFAPFFATELSVSHTPLGLMAMLPSRGPESLWRRVMTH